MSYYLACVGEDMAMSYDNQYATVGDEMDGYVTFGDDWVNFYFQCASSAEILNDLLHNMNELYDNTEFPSIVNTPAYMNGIPCAARYLKDNRWYRARLVDVSYSMVYFVDYGNRQMTNMQYVKPLTKTLADLVPPLAYQCKLANFQNPLLPSFVEGIDLVRITMHSKNEPYEVSVQLLSKKNNNSNGSSGSRSRSVSSNGHVMVNGNGHSGPHMINGHGNGHGGHSIASGSRNGGFMIVRPRMTPEGLTLPSPAPKFNLDDDEDDLEKLRSHGKKTRIVNSNGKFAIVGAAGTISQLYATCGQVTPTEGLYRNNVLEFNSQETTLNNGVLWVENLTRIFRMHDRIICNARYEDPLPNGVKVSKPPSGYYQVTEMQMMPSSRTLICHAVVTFVSNYGAILYVRNKKQSVFAPASVFPGTKSGAPLSDFVELGRSVLVRAVPAEKFPDIQVSSEWVASAVEFLGTVVENQGWMYFVRENYSVIITEGGIGFGYVFAANQFLDPVRVAQEEWYGTRVLFRACLDIPDKENFRFGNRWKTLSARLLPEHSKGSYRYQGIYKPPPAVFGNVTVGQSSNKKSFEDEGDENFELPEEVLEEMRLMGQDMIGVNRLSDPTKSKTDLKEIAENLLNEWEEIPLALLLPTDQAAPVISEAASSLSPTQPQSSEHNVRSASADHQQHQLSPDEEIEIIIEESDADHHLMTISGGSAAKGGDRRAAAVATTANMAAESFVDLLGINGDCSDGDDIGVAHARFFGGGQPPQQQPSTNSSSLSSTYDLLRLWEGCDEISRAPLPLVTPRRAGEPIKVPNGVSPSLLNDLMATINAIKSPPTCDRECQTDPDDQLRWEIECLRQMPDVLSKVVGQVATLPMDVQQIFFSLLANCSGKNGN